MRTPILICLLLSITLFTLAQEKSEKKEKDYTEAIILIEAWLEAQMDYENLPGISAAMVEDQETIWSNAYGKSNIENKLNSGSTTIYSICSISKLFTSVAIMKLYDEGKIRLDDEINTLLPWFNLQQQYDDSSPITVRSLMTHSSGLPRESDHPYWTGPDFSFPSENEIKARLGLQKTLYPASTYFQYSNLGLTLLGEIIKEVSGKPYDQYIKENIINPLQLNNTRTILPENLWGRQLAKGYSAIKRDGSRDLVPMFQAEGIAAAAGYSSTVEDLAKFSSWQFRLLENGGQEILKSSTLKDMHRVQWMDPDWERSWGLGFSVYQSDGVTLVGHGGSCPGYRSSLSLDPENKMAYTVMINASGTNPGKYANGIRKIMNKVKVKSDEKSTTEVKLSDYDGYYSSQPWGGERYITSWQGNLAILRLPTDNPQNFTVIKHIDGDTFRRVRDDDTLGEEIIFERDDSGKIYRLVQHNNYSTKIR